MTEFVVPPKEIYLQFHGDWDVEPEEIYESQGGPVSMDEVSWCWEKIHGADIKYCRADYVQKLEALVDEQNDMLTELKRELRALDNRMADVGNDVSYLVEIAHAPIETKAHYEEQATNQTDTEKG